MTSKYKFCMIGELVNRDTARKPILIGETYVCTVCWFGLFSIDIEPSLNDKFCSTCGQRIDWSEYYDSKF